MRVTCNMETVLHTDGLYYHVCRRCGQRGITKTQRYWITCQVEVFLPGWALKYKLNRIGITEQRVAWWINLFRKNKSTLCGCAARREAMNRAWLRTVRRYPIIQRLLGRLGYGPVLVTQQATGTAAQPVHRRGWQRPSAHTMPRLQSCRSFVGGFGWFRRWKRSRNAGWTNGLTPQAIYNRQQAELKRTRQ